MPYGNEMAHRCDVTSPSGRYITEGWVIAHYARVCGYTPPRDALIYDPAACGVNGWSIGRALSLIWDLPCKLADLDPKGRGVESADFFNAPPPTWDGPIIHATNPDFNILDQWMSKARDESDITILVSDLGALLTATPRIEGARHVVAPRKRMAFGLTDEDAMWLRMMKIEHPNKRIPTPLQEGKNHKTGPTNSGMPSTGKPHAITMWDSVGAEMLRRGEDPPIIARKVSEYDMVVGKALMDWCAK